MTYRILTVCTGNICRSPMAELLLRDALEREGLDGAVEVASAGTTRWEEGNPIDPRAAALLDVRGIDSSAHVARAASREELAASDLVLALDHDHVAPLERMMGESLGGRLRMLRDFDPSHPEDTGIRDPWYGDERDFITTGEQIDATVGGILEHVRAELGTRSQETR